MTKEKGKECESLREQMRSEMQSQGGCHGY